MRCHKVDYEILGDDLQMVEIELDPGETVVAEAGAMNYMHDGIRFEARLGDGSVADESLLGSLLQAGKRVLTGESIFMTHFTNTSHSVKRVAFAALGTDINIAFTRRLGTGFFGGEGFILQRLRGDGLAFLHAGGTIAEKRLDGETLRVDTGCLVAMTPGIDYDIERARHPLPLPRTPLADL
jgi:uncharacterized protein (AIM24 family)